MRSACRTVEKRCEIKIVVTLARRGENPVEDLGLAAHVELGGRLVEQHQSGPLLDGAQGPRQGNALPLAAGQVDAARIAARQHRVEIGQSRRTGLGERVP